MKPATAGTGECCMPPAASSSASWSGVPGEKPSARAIERAVAGRGVRQDAGSFAAALEREDRALGDRRDVRDRKRQPEGAIGEISL